MYELAPKFRYALKWLLRGAAGLGVIAVVFATALPYLVEVRTVRDGLVKNLSEWSGGPVSIHGQLRMKSFASLSIEAEGVSFSATPRLSPIGRIEAKSVTAILKVPSLLRGRIEFKKVSVAAPRFVLARRARPSTPDHNSSLETIGAAVAFAGQSRFDRLELQDCTFLAATGERRAYSRLSAGTITVIRRSRRLRFCAISERPGPRRIVSRHSEPNREQSDWRDPARRSARTPRRGEDRGRRRAVGKRARHLHRGRFDLGRRRLSLDGATIGFDGRGAKGSLTFATLHGRALTEGTLAYDTLEWIPAAQEGGTGSAIAINPLQALIPAVSGGEVRADLDMRISAEHFRAGPYEAGPLALALTSRPDLVSVDIAELAIFGGRIAGRLDYDPRHPNTLSVNANGSRLDLEALASASAWPIAVSGPVNLRLALEIPFKDGLLAPELKAATGSFGIVFPAGGTLDGDVSKRLSEAFALGKSPWELNSGSIAFTAASMDGVVTPGGVALKLDGEAAGNRIAGSLRIAMPGGQIAGKLTVSPDDGAGNLAPASTGDSPNSSSIGLSGTVAALNFSVPRRHSLSN